jgi:hypothetical protein
MSRKVLSIVMVALVMFASTAVLMPTSALAQSDKKVPHKLSAFMQSSPTATTNGLTGLFQIDHFDDSTGVLMAVGTLYGNVVKLDGSTVPLGDAGQSVSIPVAGVDPTCQILNLTLGPLDLNLLGLQVHLNQVVLNITAESGNGNLLGNLLCAVAGLLNGTPTGTITGLLTQLTSLLNQILSAL